MILDNGLDIESIMKAIDLIISHRERYQTLILNDTLYNLCKVLLKLIIWQVDFQEVFVSNQKLFGDDRCWLEAHTLVFEAKLVISLVQLHLSYKSLLLFISFIGNSKIHAFSFI